MTCPSSGHDVTSVYDSRPSVAAVELRWVKFKRPDNSVHRRRKCRKCGFRYSTFEITADDLDAIYAAIEAERARCNEAHSLLASIQAVIKGAFAPKKMEAAE
jgi:transcriptional regulator NrdR family protein